MNEIIVAEATWDICLNVTCPWCEHYFDLTGYHTMADLPPCGQATKDCNIVVDCPECSREFVITEVIS